MQLADALDERFCNEIVNGRSATKAAALAGHLKGAANYGARLLKRPEIQQRILELQANSSNQIDENGELITSAKPSEAVLMYVGKPWVVTELVSLHKFARKNKDISGSNTALRTLAQIGGLLDGPNSRLNQSSDPQRIALLGIKEIHAMLSGLVGQTPKVDRLKLLAEAPELRELVGDLDETQAGVDESASAPVENASEPPSEG